MKALRKAILPLTLATALSLAAPAAAQEPGGEVVPPGNSAVNQYTEAFPTAGGNRDAHEQGKHPTSPREALGARKARRLQRQGSAGKAVAELVAETAPATTPASSATASPGSGQGAGTIAAPGGSEPNGGGNRAEKPGPRSAEPWLDQSGSSGFGAVLAESVGASSPNGAALLLPLLLLATLVWAIAYAVRQRRAAD